METSPQARIQIINTAILAPGICIVCGSAGTEDREFLDFGKQLDWYGAVYLCTLCVPEMATACDFIPGNSFHKLYDEHRKLQISYDQLSSEHVKVKDALGSLLVGTAGTIVDNNGTTFPVVEESDSTNESNESSTVGDSETDESTVIEGPDDVFDASDYE
jgi:hypothetical protein